MKESIPECPACVPRPRDYHTRAQLREFHPGANPECEACQQLRLHTKREMKLFHPMAGHGRDFQGPCCPHPPAVDLEGSK